MTGDTTYVTHNSEWLYPDKKTMLVVPEITQNM